MEYKYFTYEPISENVTGTVVPDATDNCTIEEILGSTVPSCSNISFEKVPPGEWGPILKKAILLSIQLISVLTIPWLINFLGR